MGRKFEVTNFVSKEYLDSKIAIMLIKTTSKDSKKSKEFIKIMCSNAFFNGFFLKHNKILFSDEKMRWVYKKSRSVGSELLGKGSSWIGLSKYKDNLP